VDVHGQDRIKQKVMKINEEVVEEKIVQEEVVEEEVAEEEVAKIVVMKIKSAGCKLHSALSIV
jgi:hypothetical protein